MLVKLEHFCRDRGLKIPTIELPPPIATLQLREQKSPALNKLNMKETKGPNLGSLFSETGEWKNRYAPTPGISSM